MTDFDEKDCVRRYRALVAAHPDRFANPPGHIYEILLDDERMAHARAEEARRRHAADLAFADTRVGVLAEDPYLRVVRDAVRFADGAYGVYNRIMVPSGAAILPRHGDSIVLLHRFRHGTRSWHLEVPRGAFSGRGTRADEARRELAEEIGAEALRMIDLGLMHATTGCLDEAHHLFLAEIGQTGTADRHEAIERLVTLPVGEAEAMIADGRITDGPTIGAFFRARLRGHL